MLQIAKLIGGAGTGKTAELLRVMQRTVRKLGGDPMEIGFVSFTRAARREASQRAADQFRVPLYQLEQKGWFRTLHSACNRCLNVGKALLTDDKESRQWIENAVQESIGNGTVGHESEGFYMDTFTDDTGRDAARALHLWSVARNRLEPLEPSWRREDEVDSRTPSLDYCLKIVDQYEQSKRLDHRLDFVDLLSRFAGWRLNPRHDAERCEPVGEPPHLKAWFLDEQQDTSALLDSVCQRLIHSNDCKWVYAAGDPFQSVYGWAGSDHRCFLDLKADKERVMPRSYRCGERVLRLGELILSECADYFDRRISPADHESTVQTVARLANVELDPSDEWLILARTNYIAAQVGAHLDRKGIPWLNIHGGGHWAAPSRNKAIAALSNLEAGSPIDGSEWVEVLKFLPSRDAETKTELLVRGTKVRFEKIADPQSQYSWVQLRELDDLGATETLVAAIQAGTWRRWLPEATEYLQAVERWGHETVARPKILVGTIHSAKGREADNVLLLTSLSGPCVRGAESQEGADEQRRLFYVGATRARHRLVVLDDQRERNRMELPEV